MVRAYFIRSTMFSEDRVVVAVSGQEHADSGKLLTYEISYNNNNVSASITRRLK